MILRILLESSTRIEPFFFKIKSFQQIGILWGEKKKKIELMFD